MSAWPGPHRAMVWAAPLVVDGPASFRPDGRLVACPSLGRVALFAASSGRLVRQTDVLPGSYDVVGGSRVSIAWEDASNLIASWEDSDLRNRRFRCAAATAACQPLNLGVGDAGVVMAR